MPKKKVKEDNEVEPRIRGGEKQKNEPEEKAAVREVKPPQQAAIPDYARGYTLGLENGFKMGLENRVGLELERKLAFDQGVRHIVTLAENFLVRELKLASRDELAHSQKIPAWWIATLVTDFSESGDIGIIKKAEVG